MADFILIKYNCSADAVLYKVYMFRVLITEDDKTLFESYRTAIGMAFKGMVSVEHAGNGMIASEKVANNVKRYEVVVMDLNMPIMDGVEASKKLRDAGYKNPILVHSALQFRHFKGEVVGNLFSGFSHKSKGVKGLIKTLIDLAPHLLPYLAEEFVIDKGLP